MQRLSCPHTTAATYSCAGIVKRGLREHGFHIKKVRGFGRKREMLTATMTDTDHIDVTSDNKNCDNESHDAKHITTDSIFNHTAIIGAGVSGLLTAWSLANRGITVTLLDKSAPLAGASGNPRALLAPKMTPIHHVDEHLHTIGYLHSSRLYRDLNRTATQLNTASVLELTGALDLLIKANIGTEQIADYPDEMATTLSHEQAQVTSSLKEQDYTENSYLPQSGLVNPQALKNTILTHPLIHFQQLEVNEINETEQEVRIEGIDGNRNTFTMTADNVVIFAAFESHQLDQLIFDCLKIRVQLSWFSPSTEQ